MAYNITLTNGANLVTVQDGTTDVNYTSLTLVGKNFAGYGQFLNENFVKLLENFSNSTQPANALQGQVWWDSTNKLLKVYSGAVWKTVSSSQSSATQPANPVVGDLWWDTANGQLKVWGGSTWIIVGPAYTASQGQTGIVADIVVESGGPATQHIVSKFFVNNVLVAVLSKDAAFPVDSLTGFTVINPGFNLSSVGSLGYFGNTDNASKLGGVLAADYLRSNIDDSTSGSLSITSNTGLLVGAGSDATLSVTGNAVNLTSTVNSKDLNFYATRSNVLVKAMSISGTSNEVLLLGNPISNLGIATKQYVDSEISGAVGLNLLAVGTDIIPDTNGNLDIGSSGLRWDIVYANTFNGVSTSAKYADLAERFEADRPYVAGTVVELGGVAEITAATEDLSDNVFGVVSTRAAYLMNSAAGSDETHPAIAMQGRVPVRVIGKVKKGDRLVSAGNGLGRAAAKSEVTPFNVIGRALTSKDSTEVGTVEAIVKLNS